MRYLDLLHGVFVDVAKSEALFNRAAVRIANPAARRLLCTLRDRDMALLDLVRREMTVAERQPQPPAESAGG